MRIIKLNWFKSLVELHKEWTEAGVKASRATTHRCVKEFGYSCRQRRLTWAKDNWTGLLPSGPKSSFQMRASFVFHLETKVLESGGRVEKLIAQVAWSPVLNFQSVMIWGAMSSAGVGPLCFLKTNVTAPVYQYILENFMLPSADQLFKDADFIFQQDLAPAHTAVIAKSWLNGHGVGVLDWPANSPDLNPIENLGYCQEENEKQKKNADELKSTVKETWASINLSSATNWSPPRHAELRQ